MSRPGTGLNLDVHLGLSSVSNRFPEGSTIPDGEIEQEGTSNQAHGNRGQTEVNVARGRHTTDIRETGDSTWKSASQSIGRRAGE